MDRHLRTVKGVFADLGEEALDNFLPEATKESLGQLKALKNVWVIFIVYF
jgi:hypothetical protein